MNGVNAGASAGERSGETMSDHESVIIEVAINGSTKPERNPNVPLTPDAIRDDALRCLDGGASVIHAHNHDITLQGDAASDPYIAAWQPLVEKRPDLLWYPTLTSGKTIVEKYAHYDAIVAAVPTRMASSIQDRPTSATTGTTAIPPAART